MKDLEKIKKYFGEKMSNLCRDLFPTLLEVDNLLFSIVDSHFNRGKYLYDDIVNSNLEESFRNYIYSFIGVEKAKPPLIENRTPFELLSDAGYDLYECKTKDEVQYFRKYYADGEQLCTFMDDRLSRSYVFFAVKKNVDDIKRENFSNPQRQDEYGTSVISIQFSRIRPNMLSIKNRYNHKVSNPDATFSNNLENIIEGLTNSFEKYYNLDIRQNEQNFFEIPGYVLASDGKWYKYNYEINGIYYCPDNIIIDNNSNVLRDFKEKEKFIVFDYFILDLVNKKLYIYDKRISNYTGTQMLQDSFIDAFSNINKIEVLRDKVSGNRIINIYVEEGLATITIDKYNRIIGYYNNYVKRIEENFLYFNTTLQNISLPEVKRISNSFLHCNEELESVLFPNVCEIDSYFLNNNKRIKLIELPKVEFVGDNFLECNSELESISFPNLRIIWDNFICCNKKIRSVSLPKVEFVGDNFLEKNKEIEELSLPAIKDISNAFLYDNEKLKIIFIPNAYRISQYFLFYNKELETLYLPYVVKIDCVFLPYNKVLQDLVLNKNVEIDYDSFLQDHPQRLDFIHDIEKNKDYNYREEKNKKRVKTLVRNK